MFQVVPFTIVIVVVLLLLTDKNKSVNFRFKAYLASLNNSSRNIMMPYFKGVFILGLLFGLLIAFTEDGCELLINKVQQTKVERIHAYEYIGRCYVDKNCRHIVVENPVQTDAEVINLTGQIRQYMMSNMKLGRKINNVDG